METENPDTPFNPHSFSCSTYVRQIPPLPGTHSSSDKHTHIHTCTQATKMCAADACMKTYMHTQHVLSPAPKSFTETHTQKEKHTSFHCMSLQVPASPGSTDPICYNNCHTRGCQCFTLICKDLHSYHSNHSNAICNALLCTVLSFISRAYILDIVCKGQNVCIMVKVYTRLCWFHMLGLISSSYFFESHYLNEDINNKDKPFNRHLSLNNKTGLYELYCVVFYVSGCRCVCVSVHILHLILLLLLLWEILLK